MKTTSYAIALGIAVVLSGSTTAFSARHVCTTDLKSLCAGITPGEGRIHACIQSHIGELSVGCAAILSKAAWTAKECAADIKQFCPTAKYGGVANCMRPHLGEVSDQCKAAITYIVSPAADR
jgi:hypothetical protein